MKLSEKAQDIYNQIKGNQTKLGDLRKIAATIKKDHTLALELWNTQNYFAQQLAILIMDRKLLTQEIIDSFCSDMEQHANFEKLNLMDWLMANQLTKDKKNIALIKSWLTSTSALQRRTYWYYQGRLRWVGQKPPSNTEELLSLIEERIENEVEEVQWAMNFTAAQIGIFQEEYRNRCITLGEKTGLYKDEIVAKNCTPNYLPKYIAIQVEKLKKK